MANKRRHTKQYLEHQYRIFCRLQKPSEVYDLLKISSKQFKSLTENPTYQTFMIGKKSGGERHIENPNHSLKKVQERLNRYLQAVYYFKKTPLAYGFVLNASKEKDSRDILSNARKHLGKDYLLNLDIKDFFHSIKVPRIWKVFGEDTFRFQRPAVEMLTRLSTFKNRLPMGSPTSPALSNFASLALDQDLYEFAQEKDLVVTRYADDITFSSDYPIDSETYETIKSFIEAHEFKLNEKKVKFYEAKDTKEVTGLVLLEDGTLGLPKSFIPDLEQEIEQLASIMTVQNQQGKLNTNWVETFRKHLRGKINFLGYVLGNHSEEKERLLERFNEASYPPPEDFGSYSWRTFNYHI